MPAPWEYDTGIKPYESYVGDIEGMMYIPGLDTYFVDPAWLKKVYEERGILPKQPSQTDLLLQGLGQIGVLKAGDWLADKILGIGKDAAKTASDTAKTASASSTGLLGEIAKLPEKILGGIGDITKNILGDNAITRGLSSIFGSGGTEVAEGLSKAEAFEGLTKAEALAKAGVPDIIGQTLTGEPIFAGTTSTTTTTTTQPGLLGTAFNNLGTPLAAIGGFLRGYKEGKPDLLGTGGAGLAGYLSGGPVGAVLAIGANILGGIFGSRKKKKKRKRLARRLANEIAAQGGITDTDLLYDLIYSNLKTIQKNPDLLNKIAGLTEDAINQQIAKWQINTKDFHPTMLQRLRRAAASAVLGLSYPLSNSPLGFLEGLRVAKGGKPDIPRTPQELYRKLRMEQKRNPYSSP